MKKVVLTLLLFVAFATSYGQGKFHEKQNAYYVEAAAKEFSLDKQQQKELSEIRMDMVKAYMGSSQSFNDGDITKEEKQAATKEASQTYHTKLSKITGKTYAEMKPWLDKMRDELKNVK